MKMICPPGRFVKAATCRWLALRVAASCLALLVLSSSLRAQPTIFVVLGAAGDDQYAEQFREWSESWSDAAEKADALFQILGNEGDGENDLDKLRNRLTKLAQENDSPLWIVLIGHGTYDGVTAKFNLRGSDLSADMLANWLDGVKRPLVLINCAAASGPFLNRLSKENRIIVTATKSGEEQNFARFGKFIALAVSDPQADIDKDGQTSLLEAYLAASRHLDDFYKQEARLPTEHPLLDDNGDGLGTPAVWFRGIRAAERPKEGAALDGIRAHQLHLVPSDREKQLPPEVLKRRDELEQTIAQLRIEKSILGEDEYFRRLEGLMTELATLYNSINKPNSVEPPAVRDAE